MITARKLVRDGLAFASLLAAGLLALDFQQPSVRVEPINSARPRLIEPQTQTAVVRDYLDAWKSLRDAMRENRPDLLEADFIGVAKDKLASTISEQKRLGLQTVYQDRAHDIKLVFYSPEGLSLELTDNVDYDLELLDHDKVQGTQHIHARYVAVLTPTEVRWKVRLLQAIPSQPTP